MTKRAFTLIELLVVIGIIGVLMSILLPAMAAARQSARAATCASNLRQLEIAALNYSTDNAGMLPPAHLLFFTKNLDRWHGTRTNLSQPFDFSKSRLKPYLQVAKIKQCPDFEPAVSGGFEASAGGYGYNDAYLGSSIGVSNAAGADSTPAKISAIHKPAETIAFTDAAMATPDLIEYSFVEAPLNSMGPTSPSIHFRHNGRANVAWLDGHISLESMEWTYLTNYKDADNARAKLGFFGPKDNSLFDRQ
ncbi:MAG TPA: prepilin-type N-terminal cleavage/methylation domain-containing protein [Tepidisphaeraceae bacterium]|nr:prepilin-type N-terminal cleavage/methylation domain-containing protein [Tepidisphaeraceae bacterium]